MPKTDPTLKKLHSIGRGLPPIVTCKRLSVVSSDGPTFTLALSDNPHDDGGKTFNITTLDAVEAAFAILGIRSTINFNPTVKQHLDKLDRLMRDDVPNPEMLSVVPISISAPSARSRKKR